MAHPPSQSISKPYLCIKEKVATLRRCLSDAPTIRRSAVAWTALAETFKEMRLGATPFTIWTQAKSEGLIPLGLEYFEKLLAQDRAVRCVPSPCRCMIPNSPIQATIILEVAVCLTMICEMALIKFERDPAQVRHTDVALIRQLVRTCPSLLNRYWDQYRTCTSKWREDKIFEERTVRVIVLVDTVTRLLAFRSPMPQLDNDLRAM